MTYKILSYVSFGEGDSWDTPMDIEEFLTAEQLSTISKIIKEEDEYGSRVEKRLEQEHKEINDLLYSKAIEYAFPDGIPEGYEEYEDIEDYIDGEGLSAGYCFIID